MRKDPATPKKITVTVAGLLNPKTNGPLTLTRDNLTVYEDGAKKDIDVTAAGSATVKCDIVFFIDITGSMGPPIEGVKASVLDFLEYLERKGLNVNVGAVAYGDSISATANPAGIPASDRGAYVVAGYEKMSASIGKTGPVYAFIQSLTASFRGCGGGEEPEGLFDAMEWARAGFSFRPDAHRLFIAMTDAPAWGRGTTSGEVAPNTTYSPRMLCEQYAGQITVDVISPDRLTFRRGAYDPIFLAVAGGGSPGTGGIWDRLPAGGKVDLSALVLKNIAASSWLATFMSESETVGTHTLRLVVNDAASGAKGEATREMRY